MNYVLMNLGDALTVGAPQKASVLERPVWVVPILLTPKSGGYGQVGVILF